MTIRLDFEPPGPVSAAFMASRAKVQIINGPVGSGKTTTAMMKGVTLAHEQEPSRRHRAHNSRKELVPVRQFRLTVLRDTYRNLWRSTIPTWVDLFPKDRGKFTGSENAPSVHRLGFELDKGTLNSTVVDLEMIFAALGDNDIEDFMRGFQTTGWLLNELDLLAQRVFGLAQTRDGRWPKVSDVRPTWKGVLADCNAPLIDSWLMREIFELTPAERAAFGCELFIQPGGRDPGAENLKHLSADYYEPKIGQDAADIARFYDNKPGFSRDGKPVYPEYSDRFHCSTTELLPVKGIPLGLGFDAGGSPAMTVRQRMPNGQRRILDELIAEPGTGAIRFGGDARQLLNDRYPGFEIASAYADPSAAYGADTTAGERSWIQIVGAQLGITVLGGPTNAIAPRLEAVRRPLSRVIDGQPGLLISPRCKILRRGFNSGYKYARLLLPGKDQYHEVPAKTLESHVHDALQYDCSGDGEDRAIREDPRKASQPPGRYTSTDDHDPYASEHAA